MKEDLSLTRNIGLVAHIDAGKTTTTERILFYTGRNYKLGEVHEGTTTTDWMIQERERGITITSAATYCQWKNFHINIIDTPGHIDFTVEVERSLKVLDGVIVVFCGVGGVQPQSETVWRQAEKYNVARIAFVNKLDRLGANFFSVIDEMREKLMVSAAAVQIPLYDAQENLAGIIDLIRNQALHFEEENGTKVVIADIPESHQHQAAKYRDIMLEKLAELDDDFMARIIHGDKISESDIVATIRKYVIANKFFPVLAGTALRNKGIQSLLDAVCDYLPSPLDIGQVNGTDLKGEKEITRKLTVEEKFCGLCFKVFTDPFVGKLFYVRVYSGKVTTSDNVYNARKRSKEKISKILRMHANKQEQINEAKAGDIVCFVGLKDTTTGDTLCDEKSPIMLEGIRFPEPVVSVAIEPKSTADQDKLVSALKKFSEEDPSFRMAYNKETGQNIISGMGQLHLEIIVDRLDREFGVIGRVGKPQVAYKETMTRKIESVGKFIQQSGGHGQYGHVVLMMEPQDKGTGIIFDNKIKAGAIPKEFVPAVKDGVMEAAESGILAGYPVVDIKITLLDGSYHDVDSSELAFKVAAEMAFKDGLRKGGSTLLEPIMSLEVIVPNDYVSQVIGDLNSRRAQITSVTEKANLRIVKASVPLAEVFNYADALRNLTQGRSSYTIEPACYEKVPGELIGKILGI
jgi:elongation factor G